MSRQIPDELKQKALTMLETEDIDTVATTLHIRKAALLKMMKDEAMDIAPPAAELMDATSKDDTTTTSEDATEEEKKDRKVPYYSPEFKAAALAMMEEKGAVATIKELGISSYTLYDWKNKAAGGGQYPRKQGPLTGKTRKRYTPEFKAEVIEYYQAHGSGEAKKKYGISSNALYTWLEEARIERVGKRPDDHIDAIAMYREKGEEAVLEKFRITRTTLRKWLLDAGIDPARPPKYSPEFKASAVAMTEEKPLTAVAKELGVPASTLATWKTRHHE